MPSSITHNYFMQDVYDKFDNNLKKKININEAKLFAQGPDIFYFYNMCFGSKSNKYRNMGNYIHKHKVNLFFENIIKYIINNNLETNTSCLSYLYGSVCHYALDSVVHPFVFYKTGVFKKGIPNTYKYNGLHQEMEYFLDAYMIFQKEKIEAKDFKMYKHTLKKITINDDTTKLIDIVINDTYGYRNMGKIYNKCIRDMRLFFKFFNYDHFGIKKIMYGLVDTITPKRFIRKKKFSFYLTHNCKEHYLNLEKNEWNHPCDIYETYNYSFIELYIIAIDRAYNIIREIDKMFKNKECNSKQIDDLFHNFSYTTGKNCDERYVMKYFEF